MVSPIVVMLQHILNNSDKSRQFILEIDFQCSHRDPCIKNLNSPADYKIKSTKFNHEIHYEVCLE